MWLLKSDDSYVYLVEWRTATMKVLMSGLRKVSSTHPVTPYLIDGSPT
jgi:hypothetical protein